MKKKNLSKTFSVTLRRKCITKNGIEIFTILRLEETGFSVAQALAKIGPNYPYPMWKVWGISVKE